MDATHQTPTFAVKIRVDFFLERSLVKIATSDGDSKSNSLLLCLSSDVLENRKGGVDAPTFSEQGADCTTRTFRGNKDDIDISRDVDFGLCFEDRGESMREVQCLRFVSDCREDVCVASPCPLLFVA